MSQINDYHESNRKKVCTVCGKKIYFGSSKASGFVITAKISDLVKKLVNKNFSTMNSKFPSGICPTCRLTLLEMSKGKFQRQLCSMPNYEDLEFHEPADDVSKICYCYICLTASSKLVNNRNEKGRGKIRQSVGKITAFNGLQSFQPPGPRFYKKVTIDSKKKNEKVCIRCRHKIGKGFSHPCLNARKVNAILKNNVLDLIKQLPVKNQDQVASEILRERCVESKMDEVSLSTGGRKLRVKINPIRVAKVRISVDRLRNFQINTRLSGRQMQKITNFLQCEIGQKAVPSHYRKTRSKASKILQEFYHIEHLLFDVENSKAKPEQKSKEIRPVVYANATELLEAVVENRQLIGNYVVKVCADGGRDFFKISFTILPENYTDDDIINLYKNESGDSDDFTVKKRRTRADGGIVGKEAKPTSVHKLILLCIVPKIKETYENMKLLVDLTQLNDIMFKFVGDFKIILIINGQQTASSTYPCPYCPITLFELRENNFEIDQQNLKTKTIVADDDVKNLKTYGELRNNYDKFSSLGNNKKFAKECGSTINRPLFEEADHTRVLDKCVLPELHLMQGFVNHLFFNGLVKLLGKDTAFLWPKKLNIISKNYHGELFEGNACRKLLKEAHELNDSEIYRNVGYFAIVPYINAFKAMDKIVHKYFSQRNLQSELERDVNDLKKNFEATGVSKTLKIHMIIDGHLKDCLENLGKFGLGIWSEQAGESIHREFLYFWNKYICNDLKHHEYATRLMSAVVEFSSMHI